MITNTLFQYQNFPSVRTETNKEGRLDMNKKMKPVSEREFVRRVTKSIQNKSDFCLDNMGQLVLYTGFYLWSDNTIHDNEEFHPDTE